MLRATLIALVVSSAAHAQPPDPSSPQAWAKFAAPSDGPARAIGGYSNGCIEGAVALDTEGEGWRIAKPERNRRFGHPLLVGLIRDLGHALARLKAAPLSVGDLGQPRGGPAPSGHASHQTGLDVDVWFLPPDGKQTVSMIDASRKHASPRFDDKMMRLVELAAADARVDRLFVHPALKQALCEKAGAARDWLRKVRPWWGHDDHFHVRLACPKDSPDCVAQSALPSGDGCGELAWWFDEKAQKERDEQHQKYGAKVGAAAPRLPTRCLELATAPSQ
jgi:penicillin-insensitive murein endopeptidase